MKIAQAVLLLASCLLLNSLAVGDDSCERLAGLKISNAAITLATTVAAGSFSGPT